MYVCFILITLDTYNIIFKLNKVYFLLLNLKFEMKKIKVKKCKTKLF